MTWILPLLKYWKAGGITLLLLAFFLSAQIAHRRGHELEEVKAHLTKTIHEYNALENARRQDRNRDEFRKTQTRKLKTAQNDEVSPDAGLRAVYDGLRKRQAGDAP